MSEGAVLLTTRGLRSSIADGPRLLEVVRGVDLTIDRGEIVGLAGESGAGKSQLGLCLIGMESGPPGIVAGEIRLDGKDLLEGLSGVARLEETPAGTEIEKDLRAYRRRITPRFRQIRGRRITTVFQEPRAALDPLFNVGEQLAEALEQRTDGTGVVVKEAIPRLLERVGLPTDRDWLGTYPHELSGGMSQRLAVALALAPAPDLLIADEPTSSLDATLEARILDHLVEARSRDRAALLLITHDLRVLARRTDRTAVMYAGRIVEISPSELLFDPEVPHHPYVQALTRVVLEQGRSRRLPSLPGEPPDPATIPGGCAFHPRCPLRPTLAEVEARLCAEMTPAVEPAGESRIACHATH